MADADDHTPFNPVHGRHRTPLKTARARELRKAMTPEERKLWAVLRDGHLNGLYFRRQQVIRSFVADFYCHSAKLVVEVDGGVHEDQRGYDDQRDTVFAGYGLYTLRITNDQIYQDIQLVISHILEIARHAGAI